MEEVVEVEWEEEVIKIVHELMEEIRSILRNPTQINLT